jgi:cytochrome P450
MSLYTPPFPKRHKRDPNPARILYLAHKDLLSIWTEDAFRYGFMSRKIYKQSLFIANHPDIVRHVMIEHNSNYERKSPMMVKALRILLGDGLFISHGETWKKQRKLQTPLFTASHVETYSRIMVDTALELCERWQQLPDESEVYILDEMAKLTAEIICRTLFGQNLGQGKAAEVIAAFTEYQAAIEQMDFSTFIGLPEWLPMPGINWKRARKAANRIHDIVDEIIVNCKQNPDGKSLLFELIRANQSSDNEQLTDIQIRNEIIVLFMAGHETTANTLAWAWYLISQMPDTEARIHEEIKRVIGNHTPNYDHYQALTYTRAVLDETMRLYPPVPILSRQAWDEDTIRDRHVPKDSIMLVSPWLLHRHERYWKHPNQFMPERFLPGAEQRINKYVYIPFSIGPRVCLGKYFGQVELVLCLAAIAQQFRLRLPLNTTVTHECRLTLRPKGRLPMKLEKR